MSFHELMMFMAEQCVVYGFEGDPALFGIKYELVYSYGEWNVYLEIYEPPRVCWESVGKRAWKLSASGTSPDEANKALADYVRAQKTAPVVWGK